MSFMRQSELCILAVDDRIRGVLQSESTSKGKGKKSKGKPKSSISKSCEAFTKITGDHRRRSKFECLKSEARQVLSGPGGRGKHVRQSCKGKGKPQNTSFVGKSTGKSAGKSQSKPQNQAFIPKGKDQGQTIERPVLHKKGDPKAKGHKTMNRFQTILEISTCEGTHDAFEELVAEALTFLHMQLSQASPC